ncbi:hypothetical protein MMYC01_202665 [Madurella mycetomatis]|uniref:Uncharacterized protein n=1 Tax=Madurella mycetomatis TaxID=100816 RepID=A0A175WD70_9PEZI|nr:hypothetical protein MMYC01_202665 [Madurella mycetomatis]
MFTLLSVHRGDELRLAPRALIELERLPEETRKQIQLVAFEDIAEYLENPAEFEMLWKQRWLPMFEAAITQSPAMEEWLTKLWLAYAGRYTLTDLEFGRMYSGSDLGCFENMHLRRLVAGSNPYHRGRCECVDKGWRFHDPGVPRATEDPLTDGHHDLLTRYTDPRIVHVYLAFYSGPDALGTRGPKRALVEIWRDAEFQAMLGPLKQVARTKRMQLAQEYRNKAWDIKAALLNLELLPPQNADANPYASSDSEAAALLLQGLSEPHTDEDAPADSDVDSHNETSLSEDRGEMESWPQRSMLRL